MKRIDLFTGAGPWPARSVLGQLGEHEQAYLCLSARLLRFDRLAGFDPVLPILAGLALQPRPAGELRRFMVDRGTHGALLSLDHALTMAINAARYHRQQCHRSEASRRFIGWLKHAYALGPTIVPLLYHPRAEIEVKNAINKLGDLAATGKAA